MLSAILGYNFTSLSRWGFFFHLPTFLPGGIVKMLMKNKIMQIFWSLKNLLKHVIIQRKLLLFVLTIFSFFDFFLINNAVLYSWIHSTPTQWTSDIHRHIKIWNKLYKASFVLKSIRASQPFLTQIIIAGSCLQGMCNVFKSYENLTFW